MADSVANNIPEHIRLYISQQQYDRAIGSLEQMLADTPENIDARLKLAEVYDRTGKWDAAIETLKKFVGRENTLPELDDLYNTIIEKKEVYIKL